MIYNILKDFADIPKTLGYKLHKGLAILADEKEACTKPNLACYFARDIPGADIEKCQETACKDPVWAYYFARNVPGADIEKCRSVCEWTEYAF
jgi:hypothetical protein